MCFTFTCSWLPRVINWSLIKALMEMLAIVSFNIYEKYSWGTMVVFGIMFLSNLSIWGRIIALVGKKACMVILIFVKVQGSDVFKLVITLRVTVQKFLSILDIWINGVIFFHIHDKSYHKFNTWTLL